MTQVDQLLKKALSTSSEDEAIACLRMARKRSTEKPESTTSTSKDAEYWKSKAREYHALAYRNQEDLKFHRKQLLEMHEYTTKLRKTIAEKSVESGKQKAGKEFWIATTSILVVAIMMMAIV